MLQTAINIIESGGRMKDVVFKDIRVSTEHDAISLIESLRSSAIGELYEVHEAKYKKKQKKQKGEIIDEWVEITVTLKFNYCED